MPTLSKAANSHTIVSTGWTSPSNAYADDTSRATALNGTTSKNVTHSGDFGFPDFSSSDIPDNSTINSVVIRCDAYLSATVTGGIFGNQPRLNGSNNGTEATTTSLSEVQANATMSGVTLSDLRSASTLIKCRARGAKGNTSNALTVYLDFVEITVDYTIPALTIAPTSIASAQAFGSTNVIGPKYILPSAIDITGDGTTQWGPHASPMNDAGWYSDEDAYGDVLIQLTGGNPGEWMGNTDTSGRNIGYDFTALRDGILSSDFGVPAGATVTKIGIISDIVTYGTVTAPGHNCTYSVLDSPGHTATYGTDATSNVKSANWAAKSEQQITGLSLAASTQIALKLTWTVLTANDSLAGGWDNVQVIFYWTGGAVAGPGTPTVVRALPPIAPTGISEPSDPVGTAFSDTFTDTTGTNLTAHTPNLGTGWTDEAGSTTKFYIYNNAARAEGTGGGTGVYGSSFELGDGYIQANLRAESFAFSPGIVQRIVDGQNHYTAHTGVVDALIRITAGVEYSLGSLPSDGGDWMRFQAAGSSPTYLKVEVRTTQGELGTGWNLETSDNTAANQTATGPVGLRAYAVGASYSHTIDDFLAYSFDVQPAVASPTVILGEAPAGDKISPTGIASTEAFGTATITRGGVVVVSTGIATAEAFGATVVRATKSLLPGAIASSEAFNSPVVLKGPARVLPGAISSEEAFGTAVVSQPAVALTIEPSAITSTEVFGTATILRGGRTLVVTGIATAESVSSPTLLKGTARVIPTGIATSEVFGTATTLRGSVVVIITAIASTETFGTASVSSGGAPAQTITTTAVDSEESFGTATLLRGGVKVLPTGITSTEAVGSPAIRASAKILPTAIASAQALGNPVLTVGGVAIQPSAITSAEAFGNLYFAAGQLLIAPVGLVSTEAFGTTLVRPGGRTITVTAINTAQALGTPVLAKIATISPSGITSAGAYGVPVVIRGAVSIVPQGATTGEALGTPTIVMGGGFVLPTPIGSSEAFGNAIVSVAAAPSQSVEPTAIDTGTVFGVANLRRGNVNVLVSGIGTAAAVPNPFLYSYREIRLTGITSAELLGLPVVAKGPAYIRPNGIESGEVVPSAALANLLDSWRWVNNSPAMTGTRTGGWPVIQSGLYDTTRQEGEG